MAIGKPLLATWSSNTLRIFELSEAGFVQIASTSLSNKDPLNYPPGLFFVRDSRYLAAVHTQSYWDIQLKTFHRDLTLITSKTISNTSGVDKHRSSYSPAKEYVATAPISSQYYVYLNTINVDGAIVSSGYVGSLNQGTLRSISLSPDARFVIQGVTDRNFYNYRPDDAPVSNPFTVRRPLEKHTPLDFSVWSADSRFVLFGDKAGLVEVWKTDVDTLFKVGEISGGQFGYPVTAAFSPNRRHVAISWQTSGQPTTVIYRRTGNTFQPIQTLSGTFGSLLGFTADGRYLIDAANRRAFEYLDGEFIEAVDLLANVNTGSTAQAISSHIDPPRGVGYFYNDVVPGLTLGSINIESLKIALLSADASFDKTDTTLDQVTGGGAHEVYGNGWPEGGKSLQNGRWEVRSPASVSIAFDDVTQIIVEDTLRFNYAVIYDDSHVDKKPLIFIDFNGLQRAEKDSELKLTFGADGLILYSA